MKYERWKMAVTVCLSAGCCLPDRSGWKHGSVYRRSPPSPNAPSEDNALRRLDARQAASDSDKQAVDAQNQVELRLQVQRLYAMATELKATKLTGRTGIQC
jgi:hypothetical protein